MGSFKQKSDKPPKVFGIRRAVYHSKKGGDITVFYSKYSQSMRHGYALSGYSAVSSPDGSEKTFRGDEHEQKVARFLKRQFGIEHDPRSLKEYTGNSGGKR